VFLDFDGGKWFFLIFQVEPARAKDAVYLHRTLT